MIKVVIITPVYNKVEYTRQLISSLQNTDSGVEYKLVIVDNASKDGTKDFLIPENFKGLEAPIAITNKKNKGFSIANNQGVDYVKSLGVPYYCFLNNDTIVTDGWLKEMVDCMERHAKAVIIGAKLIHPGTGRIQHAGVVELNGHRPSHIHFGQDQSYPPANKEKQYPAVTGACMLVKSSFYDSVGGFDEAYWCGWEDIDLCKKAIKLGYEVWYTPKARVYHYEGSTEGRMLMEDANFTLYTHRWTLGDKGVKL